MTRHSRRRRWMESVTLAAGAGCMALGLQPDHAPWWRYVVAFAGAALPVLAAHARGGQTATPSKGVTPEGVPVEGP